MGARREGSRQGEGTRLSDAWCAARQPMLSTACRPHPLRAISRQRAVYQFRALRTSYEVPR